MNQSTSWESLSHFFLESQDRLRFNNIGMSEGSTAAAAESQLDPQSETIKELVELAVFDRKYIKFLEDTIDTTNQMMQRQRRHFLDVLRCINKYHPNVISSEQLEQVQTTFNANTPLINSNSHNNSCSNNCNSK